MGFTPVTTLKRQATELLADVERDKQSILITQHGLPSACLPCQFMQRRVALLEAIARGEQAISDGRTVTHAQARKRVGSWLE